MIEESGVSDPGLGTAGSKIFVGGLDRSVDAGIVLQNRYHDMLGKRVEVKSAVPRGQAPPPQRGPPRSSQGYGYGQPRGGPGGPGGPGGGYGYSAGGYGQPQG